MIPLLRFLCAKPFTLIKFSQHCITMLILSYLLLFALSCICFLMTSVFANSDQSASFIHVRSGQNVYAKTSSAKVQSLHSRQIKPKSQLRTESYPRHAKATALMSLVDRTGSVGSPDIEIEV
mmetsp:Transcript_19487/g.25690  ORF Transcript_19487/g.25690 Transcript_19487/m.25690 type:complete len:122 (+) Transcript_19487:42-407(+)